MGKKVSIKIELDGSKETLSTIREMEEAQSKLNEELKDVEIGSKKYKALNKELAKTEKGLAKSGKGAGKGLGLISKGFKGIGMAMKGAGIGLVIGLVVKLTDFLMKQQPVVDAINVAFTAMDMVFKSVAEAIGNVFDRMSETNNSFEATKKVVGGLIDVALYPFKVIFIGIEAAVTSLMLAWEKSIFGDGDKTRIKELEQDLSDLGDELVELTEETGQAALDIADNIVEAATEVGTFVSESVKEISKIDVAENVNQAKYLVNLRKRAEISKANNDLLLQQYDKEAERLRQIRDDEFVSIEERQKANEKLGEVLQKQQDSMLANVDIQLELARAELKLNNNQENKIKLIEAEKEKQDVLATIEGFRSEQLVNRVSLQREILDMVNSEAEASNARLISEKEFGAEQEKLTSNRISNLQEVLKMEKDIELTRLQGVIDGTKEGTQARIDAEQAFLDKKAELGQKEVELEKQKQEALLGELQAKLGKVNEVFGQLNGVASEMTSRRLENTTDEITRRYEFENEELQRQLDNGLVSKREFDRKSIQLDKLREREELKEKKKAFNIEKGLNITNATIQGTQAVLNAYASGVATPLIGPATGAIYAGIAGAFAASQIGLIASQKFKANRGGIVPGSGPSHIDSVPSLLAPGEMVINANSSKMFGGMLSQINEAGGGIPLAPTNIQSDTITSSTTFNNNRQVVKAVVVESDITDKQRRVNRVEDSSTF